jgi:hypothetical protein
VELYGAFVLTRKEAIAYFISVRLTESISAAPIGRVSVKFYIGDFSMKIYP